MLHDVPHLWRLLRTGATFERTGAMVSILDAFEVRGWQRMLIRGVARPFGIFGRAGKEGLPPVARALQAMGPAYVKFGQVLSTRPDVVGEDLVVQLRYLQDRLPPFPLDQARRIIEAEIGHGAWRLIGDLGPPVAAASIAQVHPATWLPTGEKIAVKVLRPYIREQFRRDIGAFYFIARLIQRLVPQTRRLRPTAVVAHFEGVVMAEIDLRLEAASISLFADHAREDVGLKVPRLFWEGTGRRVLTLEWIEGLPMERGVLERHGIDTRALAVYILRLFLRHALRDGFFHADMHQGNLRVAPDGTLLLLDYGIMGRLDPVTRRHYAEILYGFLTRDYRRVAEVHFEAGYVPSDRDVEAFAQALRVIGEPIHGQDVSNISMARLLAFLLETTERFGMETRTELILLQRTMVVVEGVARSLDPHTNIWQAAKPVVESYITENLGPRQALRDVADTLKVFTRLGPRLPGLATEILMLAEEARTRRLRGELPDEPLTVRFEHGFLKGFFIGSLLALGGAVLMATMV